MGRKRPRSGTYEDTCNTLAHSKSRSLDKIDPKPKNNSDSRDHDRDKSDSAVTRDQTVGQLFQTLLNASRRCMTLRFLHVVANARRSMSTSRTEKLASCRRRVGVKLRQCCFCTTSKCTASAKHRPRTSSKLWRPRASS